MTFLLDLPGMLSFRTRALRATAGRQTLIPGLIFFSAGFLAFSIVRNSVYATLPDFPGQPGALEAFYSLIRAVLFLLMLYVPAVIVLSNAVSGDGFGFAVSRHEYRAHGSALLPLWGALFLIDAPLQYFAPHFLVIQNFSITIGMLVLLPAMLAYTFWAIQRLNYLSAGQAAGVFALSLFTWPVYYLLTSFVLALPFFILIPLIWLAYHWFRDQFASRANERAFQHHLQALTSNPQDSDAHYQLGLIHLKRRNVEVARRYFENAIRIDPSDADYRYSLGRSHEMSGEWGKALEQYEETYRLNPESGLGDILREVGKAYLHTDCVEKGIEFLKFFLSKRGSDPEGRYWLAVAMKKAGDEEQMRLQLNTILEQARSHPRFFRKENREWFYKARSMIRELRSGAH